MKRTEPLHQFEQWTKHRRMTHFHEYTCQTDIFSLNYCFYYMVVFQCQLEMAVPQPIRAILRFRFVFFLFVSLLYKLLCLYLSFVVGLTSLLLFSWFLFVWIFYVSHLFLSHTHIWPFFVVVIIFSFLVVNDTHYFILFFAVKKTVFDSLVLVHFNGLFITLVCFNAWLL